MILFDSGCDFWFTPFLARKVFRPTSMVLAGKGAGGKAYINNQIQTEPWNKPLDITIPTI